MDHFVLHSPYEATGDQPQAIEKLVNGFKEGNQFETLLGVTGSGSHACAQSCARCRYGQKAKWIITHLEFRCK